MASSLGAFLGASVLLALLSLAAAKDGIMRDCKNYTEPYSERSVLRVREACQTRASPLCCRAIARAPSPHERPQAATAIFGSRSVLQRCGDWWPALSALQSHA